MKHDWHEEDLAATNNLQPKQVTVEFRNGIAVHDASTVPSDWIVIHEARFPQLIAQRRAEGNTMDCLRLIGREGVVDIRPEVPGDIWTWAVVDPYTGDVLLTADWESMIDLVIGALQLVAVSTSMTDGSFTLPPE